MGRIRAFNAATLKAQDREELILGCLTHTRCPMTAQQIREWIQDEKRKSIAVEEIDRRLKILLALGRVANPDEVNTRQFKAVRP